MKPRLVGIAAISLVLGACATQPKPLQGEFTGLTPHDAVIGSHIGT